MRRIDGKSGKMLALAKRYAKAGDAWWAQYYMRQAEEFGAIDIKTRREIETSIKEGRRRMARAVKAQLVMSEDGFEVSMYR